MIPPGAIPTRRITIGSLTIALAGFVLVSAMVDSAGQYPHGLEGPGLTLDEPFNVQQGVLLVRAVESYGLALWHPESIREFFGHPAYLPDHPPFGRFILGLAHEWTRTVAQPVDARAHFVIAAARVGSALGFAVLIVLTSIVTGRWWGSSAGLVAGVSLVLMPRVFGHAHLAALETWVCVTYAATVFSLARWVRPAPQTQAAHQAAGTSVAVDSTSTPLPSPSRRAVGLSGLCFGVALLTKMQAILLPVAVVPWAVWVWRRRALVPLCCWALIALTVFVVGWPWLWLDPLENLRSYFAQTTQRAELSVWYFGRKFSDREVPWHYAAVMFLTTVPLGLHAFGFAGLLRALMLDRRDRRVQLLVTAVFVPLVVFSLPGVPVYDGCRLFLMVFPLWAVFIGAGAVWLLEWLEKRIRRVGAVVLLVLLLAVQSWGVFSTRPCWLSYYNGLVGGLGGAEALGLEPTYWGDSLTRSFLREVVRQVPRGAVIHTSPVTYPGQWDEVLKESPFLRAAGLRFVPFDPNHADKVRYVMVFRRQADLPPALREWVKTAEPLAELRRSGVRLSGLFLWPTERTRADEPSDRNASIPTAQPNP